MRLDGPKTVTAPLTGGQPVSGIRHEQHSGEPALRRGAAGALPALALGQELDAVVLEELDNGRLLLQVGDDIIDAESPGGLPRGLRVHLKVEQLQPQVVLQITELEPTLSDKAVELLRSHLPAQADSGELLEALRLELAAYSEADDAASPETLAKLRESIAALLAGGGSPTAEKIEMLARDGGLFYESKLLHARDSAGGRLAEIADHDLKGQLLAALRESRERIFSSGLQSALSAQLDNLETQQAVNLLAQLDGGVFSLQIPFFTGSGFSTVALAVEQDGEEHGGHHGKGRGGYSLLFLLDLENFGRTRIDAHVRENEAAAVFYVDRPESVEMIRRELPPFRESLLALGFTRVVLGAKPLKEMAPEKVEKFTALAAGAPRSVHLLDFKA